MNEITGDFDEDLEEDEVLALNLPQNSRSYDEESDNEDEDFEAAPAQSKKVKKDRLSNREKDLLPLQSKTRTSRMDKPSPSTSKAGLNEDEESDVLSDDDDNTEGEADNDEDEFDNEWARTGGYHVSKREIARMEEKAAGPGGKFSANEEAEQRDALELYEARRIQKEAKDKLDETDYIDIEDVEETEDKDQDLLAVAKVDRAARTPQNVKFDNREEAIAFLLSKEPELLALLDDFSACSEKLPLVQQSIAEMKAAGSGSERKIGFGYLYQGKLQ